MLASSPWEGVDVLAPKRNSQNKVTFGQCGVRSQFQGNKGNGGD